MTEELSPRARSIVDEARQADQPTDANRERVRVAVLAAIGTGAATAASPTAAAHGVTAGAAGSSTAKLMLIATLTAAAAGGGVLLLTGNTSPAPAPAPVAPAAETNPTPRPEPAPAPTPSPEPAPAAEPEMEFAPDPVSQPRGSDRAPSTIQAERALLTRARRERQHGNPARALGILDEYSRSFAGGKLLEERAALRVLVLCDLGDTGRANREAERFRARWPGSVQANRVDGSCVDPAGE